MARVPRNATNYKELAEKSNLDRLEKTERELRAASLLVALDAEKLELFTFYRKADLLKDQKVLSGKFGPVLQANYCLISYKTFGGAAQLLRHEQSRVCGLLTRAILSSIYPLMTGGNDLLPIGPRSFLKKSSDGIVDEDGDFPPQSIPQWLMFDLSVQILASGRFVVTCSQKEISPLHLLSERFQLSSYGDDLWPESTSVMLAPSGQIARYYTDSSSSEIQILTSSKLLERFSRKNLSPWLCRCFPGINWAHEAEHWVQVSVPTITHEPNEDRSTAIKLTWNSVFWPLRLCVCLPGGRPTQRQPMNEAVDEDLLDFVRKSALQTEQRLLDIMKANEKTSSADLDESLSDISFDGIPVDNFRSQVPALMDFAPSQMIYPTPPDGPMTQPTPGMMSLDGADLTPAQVGRHVVDLRQESSGKDPMDVDQLPTTGVGSGFYDDDDLFEEIPSDKFVPAGAGDEPNWDFFDQPDADSPTDQRNVLQEGLIFSDSTMSGLAATQMNANAEDHVQQSPHVSMSDQNPSPIAIQNASENQPLEERHDLEDTNPGQQSSNPGPAFDDIIMPDYVTRDDILPPSTAWPRKKSDSKYNFEGRFFFTADVSRGASDGYDDRAATLKRSLSSSYLPGTPFSTSDATPPEQPSGLPIQNDESYDTPSISRTWTIYQPATTVGTRSADDVGDFHTEEQRIDNETHSIASVLQISNYDLLPLEGLEDSLKQNSSLSAALNVERTTDYISVAQIFVDQVTQTMFQSSLEKLLFLRYSQNATESILSMLRETDPTWERPSLTQLAQQGLKIPTEIDSRVIKLDHSLLDIHRLDRPVTASTSTLSQWDSLDVQPVSGEKPVTVYCVFPEYSNLRDGCQVLLSRLQESYRNCNLGSFCLGAGAETSTPGLIAWTLDYDDPVNLSHGWEELGGKLTPTANSNDAIVVLMISPDANLKSYAHTCSSFYRLFSGYRKANKSKPRVGDIVLQIIPMSFVASSGSMHIANRREYCSLAIEIYNRCPPVKDEEKFWICGSAVVLADSLNRIAEFQLNSDHVSPLTRGGECLHLCYAFSLDKRWITAAWTDEHGFVALTMSYCLRMQGSAVAGTSGSAVQEMWETSHDLMAKHRSKWRLIVARNGLFELEELNRWLYHSNNTSESKAKCALVLTSIDISPSLQLRLPSPAMKSTAHQGNISYPPARDFITPVSTPQANITSPVEQSVLPSTPLPTPGGFSGTPLSSQPQPISSTSPSTGEHPGLASSSGDPVTEPSTTADMVLLDPAEEFWSVLLSHGINQSLNTIDARAAQASGYLMKRRGGRDEDGVSTLGVNLLYMSPTLMPASAISLYQQRKATVTSTGSPGTNNSPTQGPPTPQTLQQQQQAQQSQAQLQAQSAATVAREALLRDIITQYKGLVTLSVTRGCLVDSVTEVLPWHISTAAKGAQALGKCF